MFAAEPNNVTNFCRARGRTIIINQLLRKTTYYFFRPPTQIQTTNFFDCFWASRAVVDCRPDEHESNPHNSYQAETIRNALGRMRVKAETDTHTHNRQHYVNSTGLVS